MPDLRRGDILLCHNHGVIPWLIQRIEHSPFGHVAWVYDERFAIEALSQGVVMSPLHSFRLNNPDRIRVVRIRPEFIRPQQLDAAVDLAAHKYVGEPYDWRLIAELGLYWACHWRHSRPIRGGDNALICSEVVARALHETCGFKFSADVPWQNIAPKDIAVSDRVVEVDAYGSR